MLKFNRGLQYFLQNATCFRRTGMISNVDELNLINKKLNLGPIDKLIKYKKIPWKGIITCVLVVLIIAQVSSLKKKQGTIQSQGYTFYTKETKRINKYTKCICGIVYA